MRSDVFILLIFFFLVTYSAGGITPAISRLSLDIVFDFDFESSRFIGEFLFRVDRLTAVSDINLAI